jgi:protein TonB
MRTSKYRGAAMFQESLVESTPLLRSRNRWPALISFATQAALVAALIAIPILHPEVLPTGPIKLSRLDPAPLPHATPPPQPPMHVSVTPATSAPTSTLHAPTISRPAPSTEAAPADNPPLAFGDPHSTASPVAILSNSVPTAPRVVAGPPAGNSNTLLPVSTGVSAGMLIGPIQPAYPQIARAAGIQGTVVIQAIISKSGRIESTRVLSGSPMLQAAALDAVRAARYRPYLLNNQPTEVETTISINFVLNR